MKTGNQDRQLRSLSFGLAVILSLIVLFRPGGVGPLPFPQADKVMHAITFALLALTAWARFRKLQPIILAVCIYALSSEVIQQLFIPGRGFELVDIVADLVGGLGILAISRKRL